MTVWLDDGWVRDNIAGQFEGTTIEDKGVGEDGRARISVIFPEPIELSRSELSDWKRFLGGLRGSDAELIFETHGDNIVITVEADETVYRELE